MANTPNKYNVGDEPNLIGRFRLISDGSPSDPSTVSVVYRRPDGDEITLVYGVDPEVTKDSVGNYRAVVLADMPGRWRYRWEGAGSLIAASDDEAFFVKNTFTYP